MSHLGKLKFAELAMVLPLLATTAPGVRAFAQAVPVPFSVSTPASVTGFATGAPFVGGVYAAGCPAATSTTSGGSIPLFAKPGNTVYNWGDGCPGYQAVVSSPGSAAVDQYGNVFFIDQGHFTIRVVYEGGAALAQAIVTANPQTTFLTTSNLVKGNVYNLVGGVESGPATSYCNQGTTGPLSNPANDREDGCPGGQAYILPRSLAVDADGNVFFTSVANQSSVQVLYVGGAKAKSLIVAENAANATPIAASSVTPGYAYLIAGSTAASGHTANGMLGPNAYLDSPRGLAIDSNENIYVAGNTDNVVVQINGTTGLVSTVAGQCIQTPVTPPAVPVTPCESALTAGEPTGYGDGGPATSALFNDPYAVAVDSYGNLFIADSGDNSTTTTPVYGRVRVVYAGGTLPGIPSPQVGYIYTYAGGGTLTLDNTPAQQVEFDATFGLSFDAAGALYVSDERHLFTTGSDHIWRIDPLTGIATIVIGSGTGSYTTFNVPCSGTKGPVVTDKYGDGCPGPQSVISLPYLGLAFDKSGNAYLGDNGYNIVHKYSYGSIFPNEPVGTASGSQYVAFDVPAGTVATSLSTSIDGAANTEYADVGATTDSCTFPGTFATDTVCSFALTFTPAKIGAREGYVQVNGAAGSLGGEFLSGTGQGVGLTVDPGTAGTLGTGITPEGVAVDEVGNAYLSDAKGNQVLKVAASGGTATALVTGLNGPRQVAVDGQGTVYIADSGNNRIVRKPVTGATTYLGVGLKSPQGVAVDNQGNVFVADTGNARVVKLGPITGIQTVVNFDVTPLVSPSSLAEDALGNLYVVDAGASPAAVYELPQNGIQSSVSLPTTITSPVGVAVDTAGDLYVADSAALKVFEVPVGGSTATPVLSGLKTPSGLAVDAAGSIYLADAANTMVTADYRTTGSLTMPTTNIGLQSLPSTLTVSNEGNASLTFTGGIFTESGNASSFIVSGGSPSPCTGNQVLAPGVSCEQSVVFSPQSAPATLSAVVAYTGTTTTANLTGNSTNLILTSTTISLAPSNSILLGQTLTITVTVKPLSGSGSPSGTVSILIDGAPVTIPNPTVVNGVVTYQTNTLSSGTHSISASYSGDSTYASSFGTSAVTVSKIPTTLACTLMRGTGGYVDTATLSESFLYATPTGTVTFYSDGIAQAALPIGTGVVTDVLALPDGTHAITATYSGDGEYITSSCASQNITVAHAPTQTALTASSISISGGTAAGIALTATVTSTVAGVISGTVQFYNGPTLLGTVAVNASGVATYTTTTAVFPTYLFTAIYSGDGNYLPSSGSATEGADFVILSPVSTGGTPLTPPISLPDAANTVVILPIISVNSYSGTLTGSCSGLPASTICRFAVPAGTILASNNTCSYVGLEKNTLTGACVYFQIITGANTNLASVQNSPGTLALAEMLGWPIGLVMLLFLKRQQRRGMFSALMGGALVLVISIGFTGCGGTNSNAINPSGPPTPSGTYNVTVTLTDSNQVTHSIVLPISVAQP